MQTFILAAMPSSGDLLLHKTHLFHSFAKVKLYCSLYSPKSSVMNTLPFDVLCIVPVLLYSHVICKLVMLFTAEKVPPEYDTCCSCYCCCAV